MTPPTNDGDSPASGRDAREVDAAVAALVAVLDHALAIAADPARPAAERADQLARVGRSIPPVPVSPVALVG
jgi:hypothetical protein